MKSKACMAAVGVLIEYSNQMDKLCLRELECRCAYVEGELFERKLKQIREEMQALEKSTGAAMEQAVATIFIVGYEKAAKLPEPEAAKIIPTLQKKVGDIALLLERIMAKFENMPAFAMGAGYIEIFKDLDNYLAHLEQA